jgi:hypothetical protein
MNGNSNTQKLVKWATIARKAKGLSSVPIVLKAVLWFIVAQVALFLLLGWSPSTGSILGWQKSSPLTLAFDLKEYAARVAGVIPPGCALTGVSSDGQTNQQVLAAFQSTRAPMLVAMFRPETPSDPQPRLGCDWRIFDRNNYLSYILGALSPEVSSIQKVTLFAFIFGLLLLRRLHWERMVHLLVINEAELAPTYAGGIATPLIPPSALKLVPKSTATTPFAVYIKTLESHVDALDRLDLGATPAHITLRCAEIGAATGDVGAVQTHLISESTKDLEDQLARFWRVDYAVWVLPTIGFLGTIYGISIALLQAKELFNRNEQGGAGFETAINNVVDGLGLAFDTTAWALLLVAILFWMQKRDEDKTNTVNESTYTLLSSKLIPKLT